MITIKLGDITLEENIDCIVNAANERLVGGGGVDGAIHRAAGPSVMTECRQIGSCPTGSAVITSAGDLKVLHIIHTVGPIWYGGAQGEPQQLKDAYYNSFKKALEYKIKSIAFPAISTGVYGYPKNEATLIALSVGLEFESKFDEIRYTCFSKSDLTNYQLTLHKLRG
ncbi:MAG: macro domain-containing protein [Bacteriovoracaceae bacterium]|nr:macro domain-containing protein [Bacteriovoracaceae bacterium]